MATIQEGLYNILKDDAAISTKVKLGTFYNIYYLEIPENKLDTNSYHIVYEKISNRPVDFIDLERPYFVISAVADTYAKAQDLREDIIRILTRYKGNMGSQRIVESSTMVDEMEYKTKDTNMYYIDLTFKFKLFGDNV